MKRLLNLIIYKIKRDNSDKTTEMRFSDSDFAEQLSEVICIEYKWRRDELMELPVGVYMAVADLENDKILITNERLKKVGCFSQVYL